jgi:repressor LexA
MGRERSGESVVTLPKLPLLGQIAAGGPLLAEQNIEDELAVPENLRGDFLLRVKGDSMIEAGILDGDIVVVRRAQDARNGDIVVALAGDDESTDEATVKTIYADYVQVLGKVVGVFREL